MNIKENITTAVTIVHIQWVKLKIVDWEWIMTYVSHSMYMENKSYAELQEIAADPINPLEKIKL